MRTLHGSTQYHARHWAPRGGAIIGTFVLSLWASGCETGERRPMERPAAPLPAPRHTVRADDPAVRGLSSESRTELAASPVPMVLLGAEYAERTNVMVGERWCALTAHTTEGYHLSIHATDNWHDADEGVDLNPSGATPTATVRGRPAWETVNEAIRSLSWDEFGVAYSLEIECDRPEDDTRCSESTFLTEIASHLVYGHVVDETYLPAGTSTGSGSVPGGSVDPVGGAR